MNVRLLPFLSILLSAIVLFLSSLHFFLLLPITSVMAWPSFLLLSTSSCTPSSSSPPCLLHIFPRSLTLPPDLLALSFRLSSFPHLSLIYLSFGSPPSSSYFSVRRVSPSRHRQGENGWGAFRLFLLPSVYLHFSMFQVSLKLKSNASPKSFMGLPKGLQPCRRLIFDWNSW